MDELLKKYKIEEISKKTSISPSVLEKMRVGEFDKINKLRFQGFLKILKSEFKDVDFSDLEEKANNYYNSIEEVNKEKQEIVENVYEENKMNYKSYFFVIILVVIIGILLYYMNNNNKIEIENNNTNLESLKIEKIVEKNDTNCSNENNATNVEKENINRENEIEIINQKDKNSTNSIVEMNKTKLSTIEDNNSKKYIDTNLTIKPLRKVWFKVYYLDLNKSKEFLTNNFVELNASKKMFIKFGHGMVKLFYNSQVIFPNTKKVTRIVLQNNEINITKKRLKSFK